MKRRDFLGLTTVAAGTLALNPLTGLAQTTTPPEPVEPVWVPLTKDVKTTRIGFGTGMRGGNRRSDLVRAGYPKAIEMLRYAYDQGIRLFDCADMYGTHDVVSQALQGKPRDSYVLVTKCWVLPGALPETERPLPEVLIDRFLREFGPRTEYIDVVQIHCMQNNRWTRDQEAVMESLARAKKAGKIRAHGISSHSNAATELAAETDWCDVIHVRINSEGMSMDGSGEAAVAEAVRTTKKAHDAGKGIIAMKVVGEGRMNDIEMRRKSTKFVMDLGTIDNMIIGFTEMEQITEFIANVKAAERSAS
ncbi:MAG: aldo/keto reductase [Planctomycetaceae bacterium]|nr:aldo/keto reductase [Planctomycetaceae bacterium]